MNKLVEQVQKWACKKHASVNQEYNSQPYALHLTMVACNVARHMHVLPIEDRPKALMAAWCHDLIEDARVSYNDLTNTLFEMCVNGQYSSLAASGTDIDVANAVYAMTTPKGKTRAERHCKEYYDGIFLGHPWAGLVKLCDVEANMAYSKATGSDMFAKYVKEWPSLRPYAVDWAHCCTSIERLLV
jgi:hypothetical protein